MESTSCELLSTLKKKLSLAIHCVLPKKLSNFDNLLIFNCTKLFLKRKFKLGSGGTWF